MKKLITLIRVCLKDNMSIFKLKGNASKYKYLPFILALLIMSSFYINADQLMSVLDEVNLQYVIVTMFILGTTIMTFMEGIYKSSGLLFNCKDDDLLLTIPIKRSTVFFIRVLKFYVFELIFNSLFLLPALACYAVHVHPGVGYYLISVLSLLLLPIIPIVLSTIVGIVIAFLSSMFKNKNIMQTYISFIFIGILLIVWSNMGTLFDNLLENAKSINDIITMVYYPAGLYVNLITNYKVLDLIIFILIHVIPFIILIISLKNVYFSINSKIKIVKKIGSHNKDTSLNIKVTSRQKAFIKKELKRLVNTPVYILNSCFGLVIYTIAIVMINFKIDMFKDMLTTQNGEVLFDITGNISIILLLIIVATALLTNLTCCMISLEGKSINILKSLPIRPIDIIMYKVNTTLTVEVPIMIIGLIVSFINFKINIFIGLLLIICAVILPLISGLIGIIVNLKFPKLDAKDDTEVVKQSMSSFVSVMAGMFLTFVSIGLVFKLKELVNINLAVLIATLIFTLIAYLLYLYAKVKGTKDFEKLVV